MDKSLLEGTWQEFEALIRDTIGSDFCWRDRVFPEKNTFIEKD